jgi:putative tryptophan/tyrosine transport system substrate-binding protein
MSRLRSAVILGVVLLVALALCASSPASAQSAAKPARVGMLIFSSVAASGVVVDHFRAGLREIGYVEGQTLLIEYRAAENKADRLPMLARELVEARVDVIYVATAPAALAAKEATAKIPIVFAGVANPVGLGLVRSLGRPGGNVTGVAFEATLEQGAKQLELLKELTPSVTRIGMFRDPAQQDSMKPYQSIIQSALSRLDLELLRADLRNVDELDSAFATLMQGRVHALWLLGQPAIFQGRARIADFALKHRLPSVASYRQYPDANGLASFGASLSDNHRRGAVYVDRILRGAQPADVPVEQPSKYELVINLKTAKALGLTIPPSVLLRADHVIE